MSWQNRRHRRRAINTPGHAHELTFSCYRGYKFLAAERTCEWPALALDNARRQYDFALWSYVFMPEHAHAIVFPHDSNYSVSLIVQKIKEPVGRKAVKYLRLNAPHWIPRITRTRGTRVERAFWQSGGGYDRNIDEPRTMQSMVTYIHENPVRRGLVARACEWKWSSAGWFQDERPNSLEPDPIPAEWLDLMDFG